MLIVDGMKKIGYRGISDSNFKVFDYTGIDPDVNEIVFMKSVQIQMRLENVKLYSDILYSFVNSFKRSSNRILLKRRQSLKPYNPIGFCLIVQLLEYSLGECMLFRPAKLKGHVISQIDNPMTEIERKFYAKFSERNDVSVDFILKLMDATSNDGTLLNKVFSTDEEKKRYEMTKMELFIKFNCRFYGSFDDCIIHKLRIGEERYKIERKKITNLYPFLWQNPNYTAQWKNLPGYIYMFVNRTNIKQIQQVFPVRFFAVFIL